MEPRTEFVELRSEEVQELLTKTSPWLLRYGVIIIFTGLFIIFLATWIIHYPDLVSASFKLMSVNAPKAVVSRSEGKLIRLFATEGQKIKAGQVMAFIESTGNHEEVLRLERQIEMAWAMASSGNLDSLDRLDITSYHYLGELQSNFQVFVQSHIQLKNFLSNGYYAKSKKLLEQEYRDLDALEESLLKQKSIHENDIILSQGEFEVQKRLAENHVIAPLELRREESKNITRKLPYQQVSTALINNALAKKAKKKEMLELDKQVAAGRDNFLQSINTLKSELEAWKLRYIVVAPVSGTIYFASILQENQHLTLNEELFYIAPHNAEYYGELLVPQQNFGKIGVGQDVLIKFAGYPFEEYGIVKGKIQSIANVSTKDNVFRAKVILPHGLKTNYGKELSYKTGMAATAEIITLDQRIIEKLFYQLRKVMGARG